MLTRDAPTTCDQQSRHNHGHQQNVAQRQRILRRQRQRRCPHEHDGRTPEEHRGEQGHYGLRAVSRHLFIDAGSLKHGQGRITDARSCPLWTGLAGDELVQPIRFEYRSAPLAKPQAGLVVAQDALDYPSCEGLADGAKGQCRDRDCVWILQCLTEQNLGRRKCLHDLVGRNRTPSGLRPRGRAPTEKTVGSGGRVFPDFPPDFRRTKSLGYCVYCRKSADDSGPPLQLFAVTGVR